jgi:hypothetical protein
MKKIYILFFLIAIAGMFTGCAVKSDLDRVDGYPRNYPVY